MTQFTVSRKIFQPIPETTPPQNHPSKTQKSPAVPHLGGGIPRDFTLPESYAGASKNSETTE